MVTGAVNGKDLRMCSRKNKDTGTVMGTSTNMLTGTGTSADMGMVTGKDTGKDTCEGTAMSAEQDIGTYMYLNNV